MFGKEEERREGEGVVFSLPRVCSKRERERWQEG
jgi:hypothetical protein